MIVFIDIQNNHIIDIVTFRASALNSMKFHVFKFKFYLSKQAKSYIINYYMWPSKLDFIRIGFWMFFLIIYKDKTL